MVACCLHAERTGIVDLHRDVQTCGYRDVQVMWDMLGLDNGASTAPAARTPEAAAVLDTVVLVPPIVIVEVRICADERRIAHCTESSPARPQRGALLCAADDWHVCVLLARAPSNEVNC
jgi:hypothetical protein